MLTYEDLDRDPNLKHQAESMALTDVNDVARCDVLILFTEPSRRSRGGKHVEMGMALSQSKRVHAIGPCKENIFHYLYSIKRHDSWSEFMDYLKRGGSLR